MALAFKLNPDSYFGRLTRLKKLFWLYFFLLIFEGALRKWVVPPLSAPLLIIRDPVSIMIIWEAYRTGKWPHRWSSALALLTVLMVGLFAVQLVIGGNPLLVGLYGLRSYLLPFPVIFIMGENLDREDLRKLVRCTLWLALFMAPLAVAQYQAPAGSFLNRGAYAGGEQIGFAAGHLRASGTFSFSVSMVHFGTVAGAFVLYAMVEEGLVERWLLWASSFAVLITVPVTGQRSLVVQLAGVLIAAAIATAMGVSQFAKVLRIAFPLVVIYFLVSLLPVFSDSVQNLNERIAGGEGGSLGSTLYIRAIESQLDTLHEAFDQNGWLGIGIGRGAVAVQELLAGSDEAVAGEDEWSRELFEMGLPAAVIFILFKLALLFMVLAGALARARDRDPLSLLLFPLVVSTLFYGLFEQPSIQGFTVAALALSIAAARPVAVAAPRPVMRFSRVRVRSW